MLAGKRIVKLNFWKKDDPLLTMLRRVLRDARTVAKQHGITMRIGQDGDRERRDKPACCRG
jgi:hypothetical protein